MSMRIVHNSNQILVAYSFPSPSFFRHVFSAVIERIWRIACFVIGTPAWARGQEGKNSANVVVRRLLTCFGKMMGFERGAVKGKKRDT
ncbi:hypothetical protein BLNAU_616 [Blattamonas nauphoetae]|uniref:Uncharacterized protein n=1 Tax=Blattamonas nauphoetae TaxID=2049346 RepID=A0ABQ9YMD0_9EUKA|nr:hypothetical protein BLNAU_616 [Blattamonas nauphoetae]